METARLWIPSSIAGQLHYAHNLTLAHRRSTEMPIIHPLKPQFEHLDSKDPEIGEIHAPKRLPPAQRRRIAALS